MRLVALLGPLVVAALAVACAGSEAAPQSAPVDDGPPGDKCDELAHTCHYVDTGEPGEIHTCHEYGHSGPESRCVVEFDRCTALCKAAQKDSGTPRPETDASTHPPEAEGGLHTHDASVPHVDAGGISPKAMCIAMGNRCHKLDTGPGPIHDCHEIGHDEVLVTCVAHYAECMALCPE